MAKDYRDIVNPITAADWFLYYLFTDEDYTAIRNRWRNEIDDIDSGLPGKAGLPFLEQENITNEYVKLITKTFRINKETALQGLTYTANNRALNKHRIPTAKIENDRITISVGASTRLEDLEHLWNIQIVSLQEKLPNYKSQRDTPATDPFVAYIVHKERLSGRKLTEIHSDYLIGKLDTRLQPGDKWIDVNDFRKYYDKTVKGYVEHP